MVAVAIEELAVPREPGAEDAVRANAYALLGTLLARSPSEELLALLQSIDPPNGDEGGLASAWARLQAAAETAHREALDQEYNDLFFGVGRGEVLPYGSYYLTGFLMERPLALLRADLAALGFERQQDVSEPEDHAAALCETMGLIISSDGEIDLEAQRSFFNKHVEPWMGRFFRDLRDAESARFYRAVGELGERFIEFETRYLAMAV